MKSQNRRNFLKISALAGSSLFATAAFGKDVSKSTVDSFEKITKHRSLGSGKKQNRSVRIGIRMHGYELEPELCA